MSEETNLILLELECLNQKIDVLIENQRKMSQHILEIMLLRGDKVSVELQLLELHSDMRKIFEILQPKNLKLEEKIT